MNEQTTKLLEQLAQKLGTTTEYLWAILIKQAPIDSAVTLFQFLIIALYGYILFRLNKWFFLKKIYERYEEFVGIPMLFGLIVFLILAICAFFSISDVFYGFLNPEYWALKKVFSLIK